MANVLEKIVANKREELISRKESLPLSEFKEALRPSDKSLFAALSTPNAGYILECKKASPSKGLIREPFDLDEIIAAYGPHAAGISVLTDEKYFQGSYDYLTYVTQRVEQPVLNKDFFVDPYQVYLARYYHADAILLMLSVLSDDEYRELASVADALHLDILTEVSNSEEMQRAIALKASIIGINNRNLRDLSTDLATTETLVPLLDAAEHDFVVISESGIYTHQDVLRLAPYCDGFLVGSALMAQPDLPRAVAAMIYGSVKVCGLTSAEDARIAQQAGASYLGLIFAEKSPRCVDEQTARQITDAVPGHYVGVFVNHAPEKVAQLAQMLNLTAVQLHGNEDKHYRRQLASLLPERCAVWQAVGVSDAIPDTLDTLMTTSSVDNVLLDCQVGNQHGGTGQQFNWDLLDSINNKHRLILAGGINADNALDAVATGVAVIDVNSGVETAPGKKSAEKIHTLFAQLRQY
ncbi:bifunctional indole-3-glycerol-phosphate synthase TrpC/phosphoribosylanthranilate isomerase TrpF [Alteromonas halophila]|uniref:Multifunctional fusion protein n=1 Tax=Alteromonas halophila TaxID=516698 RepID=A0A918JEC8_9ALTE|nr:bifunctional indole-3-glycerol-phosphate synthase TrpC/phosphoribosylanthranilate isomerase TrpF [Alteromonas halophila]GGW75385.1 tryptophan biosynthesis protein TrpCF [Alteromonas halophila]